MKDDDVTALLTKTRDYLNFIKSNLDKESVLVKNEDADTLKNIDTYLDIVSNDIAKRSNTNSEAHKSIVGTCIIYLQRLDRIAKDYRLLQNGSSNS